MKLQLIWINRLGSFAATLASAIDHMLLVVRARREP
jgi:hypothetical protein